MNLNIVTIVIVTTNYFCYLAILIFINVCFAEIELTFKQNKGPKMSRKVFFRFFYLFQRIKSFLPTLDIRDLNMLSLLMVD